MKDNLTLLAAAAGGFMLSVVLSGILHGGPVVAEQGQSSFQPVHINHAQFLPGDRS